MPDPISERMTLREAARRTGHRPVSLRQAAERGRLKVERVGVGVRATLYVTEEDLQAYLSQRRTWRGYTGNGSRDDSNDALRTEPVE